MLTWLDFRSVSEASQFKITFKPELNRLECSSFAAESVPDLPGRCV